MIMTRMTAKGEMPLMTWIVCFPGFIWLGSVIAVSELGPGTEYVAYLVGGIDFFIGFMTITSEARRKNKLFDKMEAKQNKFSHKFETKINDSKLVREQKKVKFYRYLFKDVFDRYYEGENYTLGDKKEPISGNKIVFCGLPLLTRDYFILILRIDRIIKLNPWKLHSSDAVVCDLPLTDPENPVDANSLVDQLGGVDARTSVVEGSDDYDEWLSDGETRKREAWFFLSHSTSITNVKLLRKECNMTNTSLVEDCKAPDIVHVVTAHRMIGLETKGDTVIKDIHEKFVGYGLLIERSGEKGTPIVASVDFVTNGNLNYLRKIQPTVTD